MKNFKLIAMLVCGAFLVSFTKSAAPAASSVKWKKTSIDIGNIEQGKSTTIEFEFTNAGAEAVIVNDAHASCGCTVADFPKQPVAPGKTEKITAVFSAPVKGTFNKTVTVTIQGEEPTVLSFSGTVI